MSRFSSFAIPDAYQVSLKALGRQIKLLRKQRGLTQVALAERAQLGMKYLGEIERGTTNPTLRLLCQLSQALEVELAELFQFAVGDTENDGALRLQILGLLKDHQGAELDWMNQLIKLLVNRP